MRFMVMAILEGEGSAAPKATSSSGGVGGTTAYGRSLQRAGILLAQDGLFPPSTGARISCVDGKPAVTEGPFVPSRGALGGYWILEVRSREEAIEWAKRAPVSSGEVIEVRQIREMTDDPELIR